MIDKEGLLFYNSPFLLKCWIVDWKGGFVDWEMVLFTALVGKVR